MNEIALQDSVAANTDVSVVVTCYNEGKYIEETIKSVLAQSSEANIKEILIADDGSDQSTIDVLRRVEMLDERIQVIYGSGGARQAAQRNQAVERATAPFIAFLDGDDIWAPEKLSKQIGEVKRDNEVGLVYTGYFTIHEDNKNTRHKSEVYDLSHSLDVAKDYFLNDPPILPSTVLVNRSIYQQVGGMDPDIHCFEETDFYLRIARLTKFYCVNEPLIYKRTHKSSITGSRQNLMADHAYVAFKAAEENAALMPFVQERLSERARKLGNQKFLRAEMGLSIMYLRLSVQLNRKNIKAWRSLIAVRFFPKLAIRLLGSKAKSAKAAIGAQ